jgi:hypothetical protein
MLLMAVFIANFGKGNYAWEACLHQSTIATMNDADVHEFWLSNDRNGYVDFCMRHKKTARGDPAPAQLASRWFNLMGIIASSSGDTWVHRDHNTIWWTETTSAEARIDLAQKSVPYQSTKVFECHKPCNAWSSKDRSGRPLTWDSIHPKAKDFLTTESTLQKLSDDNSDYIKSVIDGEALHRWHTRGSWLEKLKNAKIRPGRISTPIQNSVADMAYQAEQTTKNANGQIVERAVKLKTFGFQDRSELERYLLDLLEANDNQCAVSGLPLQFKGSHDDTQMLCSLDRIDSSGHYERNNLQIVCKFINFWKNSMSDSEFRRLLSIIQAQSAVKQLA